MTTCGTVDDSAAVAKSRKRSRSIWVLTVFALVACSAQLFSIQIVRGADLKEQGRVVRTAATSVEALRGKIVDSEGRVLVDSVQTYHIAVNQKNIMEYRHIEDGVVVGQGPAEAAKLLAPILDMDPTVLGGELIGDSTYQYLVKDVDALTYREIRRLGIYGIEWEPNFERTYPCGNTAATVLGSIDVDGRGVSGVEQTFDDILTGTAGEESYEIGPTGAVIPGEKVVTKDSETGATLRLTLNMDLQHTVQKKLDQAVKDNKATWGAIVVLDVETSKVLVLADSEVTDPSHGPQVSEAVQMVFEPGSVGKILTFATALENGTISPTTPVLVQKRMVIGGETFTDLGDYGTVERTATGVLAQSSNTGTLQIGQMSSDQERYDMMRRFGLGSLTGIELPGESAGVLAEPDQWHGRTKYTTMFGQGYALSALQAATIVSTLGNKGVHRPPRVVEGWTTADGTFHEAAQGTPTQAVSSEVADTLIKMMESVVADPEIATGVLSQLDGYRVAGKTGSAELGGGRIANSFVGLLPADDPKIAISAVLYESDPDFLAGENVAPLFGKVAADAVRTLGIIPSTEPTQLFPSSPVADS